MLAQLALENTTYRFDKPFTYSVPQALETAVRPGVRVTVPFGAGNRTRVAMVLSTSYESGAGQKLKAIASVLDKEPLLDDEMLALIPWMKSRCFCTLYDAVKVMIPAGIGYKLVNRYRMNAAFKNYDREAFTDTAWQIIVALTAAKNGLTGAELTERLGIEEKSSDLLSLLENGTVIRENAASRNAADATTRMVCAVPDFSGKLTPKQQSAFDTLCAIGTVTVRELSYYTGVSAGIIRTLADKGAAEIFEVERFRRPKQEMADIRLPQTLSAEQMNVANDILRECDAAEPMGGLLYGVTGSGKTAVFLHVIRHVLTVGKGVIVTVPEIPRRRLPCLRRRSAIPLRFSTAGFPLASAWMSGSACAPAGRKLSSARVLPCSRLCRISGSSSWTRSRRVRINRRARRATTHGTSRSFA